MLVFINTSTRSCRCEPCVQMAGKPAGYSRGDRMFSFSAGVPRIRRIFYICI